MTLRYVLFDHESASSRFEQGTGSVYYPRDESGKIYCDFLQPFWCNIKVDPERYVPCGPYKLLVSDVAHEMKKKIGFQK